MTVTVKDVGARLRRRARRAGLTVQPSVAAGLGSYLELLLRWNERINLTALRNLDEAIDRLLLEPLVAARHATGANSLLDVGSGGGSPAIPLKLAHPALRLVMVESKTRKAAFLREAVRVLSLERVSVEAVRVEELLAEPTCHESFDLVSLRAVRTDPRFLMSLQAFLRPGGAVLWFRGHSGPDVPGDLAPPLHWEASYPLVEWLRSRLVVLRKTPVGPGRAGRQGNVPRGT
jgi:16S rRNA (guanine527-N7)-methyltransferase